MNTTVTKGADGWQAQTDFDLDTVQGKKRIVRLSTHKSNGKLLTAATLFHVNPDGHISRDLTGDFYAVMMRSPTRCTQKSVEHQHSLYTCKEAEIKALALEFYAKKKAA
jgi:hypothetical protein